MKTKNKKIQIKLQEIKADVINKNFKITLKVGENLQSFNTNFKTFNELKEIIKNNYTENLYCYKKFMSDYTKGENDYLM